jgi:hypothetical protein
MWWNGVYIKQYRPGAVDYMAAGFWKYVWLLFFLSPYLFIPYLIYRSIDHTPAPALYVAIFVLPGAFGVYYLVKYCLTRLYEWRKHSGGLQARLFLFLFLAGFLVLRIWSVQAGFARVLRSYPSASLLSNIFMVLYAFLLLNSYVRQKFFSKQ